MLERVLPIAGYVCFSVALLSNMWSHNLTGTIGCGAFLISLTIMERNRG